jgi:hypothetical protein
MDGPHGPELDCVNLSNAHEGKEGPERSVGHHLVVRILPTFNDGRLKAKSEDKLLIFLKWFRSDAGQLFKMGLGRNFSPTLQGVVFKRVITTSEIVNA